MNDKERRRYWFFRFRDKPEQQDRRAERARRRHLQRLLAGRHRRKVRRG